jgi:hypothetical protein
MKTKSINMKTTLSIVFATMALCALVTATSQAQTNLPAASGMTNAAVTNTSSQASGMINAAVTNTSSQASGSSASSSSYGEGDDFTHGIALLIPIIAIIMGCSVPIVIVGLLLYFRHRKNIMLHETLRTMVEKGVPIPPEMFQKTERGFMDHDKSGRKHPRNDLRSGLILTGMGIGIVLFIGKPGFIILSLGVAFLVIALLEKKDRNNDQPPKP